MFVRNIAYNLNWNQLREILERFHELNGGVIHEDIKIDESGNSRGFGYVRFEEEWQATQAVYKFNNVEWEGRTVPTLKKTNFEKIQICVLDYKPLTYGNKIKYPY